MGVIGCSGIGDPGWGPVQALPSHDGNMQVVYFVASEYRISDDLHRVWFPVCTVLVYELVILGLVWLVALLQV